MYVSKSLIFMILCTVATPIYSGWPSNNVINCHRKGHTSMYEETILRPSRTNTGLKSSDNLKSHSTYPLDNMACSATIVTAHDYGKDHGILVNIRKFDLRPESTDTLSISYKTNQSADFETISYSNDLSHPFKETDKAIIYSAGDVKVELETGSGDPSNFNTTYEGFELVYTVVRNGEYGCISDEFPCRNRRCIAKELRCDGYNHCGDESDQRFCSIWPTNNEIECYMKGFRPNNPKPLKPGATTSGLNSSDNLKSYSTYPVFAEKICAATIIAPAGHGIVTSIRIFDLRSGGFDTLSISYKTDANSTNFETINYSNDRPYQNRERNKAVIYSDGDVKVSFITVSKPWSLTEKYDGFELVYTVVRKFTVCNDEEFRCNDGRCMAGELRCDGYHHCGDGSDRYNCIIKTMSLGQKIGIGFGAVFLLIAVAFGVYLLMRRRQSK